MQAAEKLSLEQIRAFLEGSEEFRFEGRNREEVYGWVNGTLRQQGYERLKRRTRGLVRRYLEKMTGLSRAQVTRLVTRYLEGEEVKPQPYRRHRFAVRYPREDVELLAVVDTLHDTLSGPATQKSCSVRSTISENRNLSVWRACRWHTYIGCGRARDIDSVAWPINRPDPRR
jgi:hypothetical protein